VEGEAAALALGGAVTRLSGAFLHGLQQRRREKNPKAVLGLQVAASTACLSGAGAESLLLLCKARTWRRWARFGVTHARVCYLRRFSAKRATGNLVFSLAACSWHGGR
jgi:hypothetical protein